MNKPEVVAEYRELLRHGQSRPTVFAIGLADDRGPATWPDPAPEFSRHLIVTLYILDGHHKIAAAAAEGSSIQFLAFFPHRYAGGVWTEPVASGIELLDQLASD